MKTREELLRPVVERYRREVFEWGFHDCALFAARCFDAQLQNGGLYEARILALKYDTALEATRLILAEGGWSPFISKVLERAPVPVAQLEFGDLVLGSGQNRDGTPAPDIKALGICDDDNFMAPAQLGLAWLPMSLALEGWKCLP